MESEKEEKFEWNSVVEQINEKIGTDIAIVDKYGMILASRVKGFEKGRLISPIFWSLIENRRKLIEQLDVSEVESFIIETDEGYMVFVFGEHIYLMSVIPTNINLNEILPSWKRIMTIFDKSTESEIDISFEQLEFEEDFKKLRHEDDEEVEHFVVFPSLIKHLAKKKKKKKT